MSSASDGHYDGFSTIEASPFFLSPLAPSGNLSPANASPGLVASVGKAQAAGMWVLSTAEATVADLQVDGCAENMGVASLAEWAVMRRRTFRTPTEKERVRKKGYRRVPA